MALHKATAPGRTICDSFVFVLMQHKNVKPLVCVLKRSLELDGFLLKCQIESFILYVSNSIESYPGIASFKKHWHDLYLLYVLYFPEIVQVVIDASLI